MFFHALIVTTITGYFQQSSYVKKHMLTLSRKADVLLTYMPAVNYLFLFTKSATRASNLSYTSIIAANKAAKALITGPHWFLKNSSEE